MRIRHSGSEATVLGRRLTLADAVITEDVEGGVLDLLGVEDADQLLAEPAPGRVAVALHEQHDVALGHELAAPRYELVLRLLLVRVVAVDGGRGGGGCRGGGRGGGVGVVCCVGGSRLVGGRGELSWLGSVGRECGREDRGLGAREAREERMAL